MEINIFSLMIAMKSFLNRKKTIESEKERINLENQEIKLNLNAENVGPSLQTTPI